MKFKSFDHQTKATDSPWTFTERMKMLIWEYTWAIFCVWTPKPANDWRLLILKIFGANIKGKPFVHQRARIQIPWKLTLKEGSCLGDRADIYCLDEIEIGEYATIAQQAYLCTGTHAFNNESMGLLTAKIIIGQRAFIGARAFILPGISIGADSIVGACSLVTTNVEPKTVVAGNPAKLIKR